MNLTIKSSRRAGRLGSRWSINGRTRLICGVRPNHYQNMIAFIMTTFSTCPWSCKPSAVGVPGKGIAIPIVLSVLFCTTASAQERVEVALRGVSKLYVHIPTNEDDAQRVDFHLLRSHLEKRLQDAGIKLLTRDECLALPNQPYLMVEVMTCKLLREDGQPIAGQCVYSIFVNYRENVELPRRSGASHSVGLWGRRNLGHGNKRLDGFVCQLVDIFLAEWKQANG